MSPFRARSRTPRLPTRWRSAPAARHRERPPGSAAAEPEVPAAWEAAAPPAVADAPGPVKRAPPAAAVLPRAPAAQRVPRVQRVPQLSGTAAGPGGRRADRPGPAEGPDRVEAHQVGPAGPEPAAPWPGRGDRREKVAPAPSPVSAVLPAPRATRLGGAAADSPEDPAESPLAQRASWRRWSRASPSRSRGGDAKGVRRRGNC